MLTKPANPVIGWPVPGGGQSVCVFAAVECSQTFDHILHRTTAVLSLLLIREYRGEMLSSGYCLSCTSDSVFSIINITNILIILIVPNIHVLWAMLSAPATKAKE